MKKWIGPFIALFLVFLLGAGLVSGFFRDLIPAVYVKEKADGYPIIRVQDEKEKGEADPHMLQILREIERKLDEWLKKLNDRIEREDVTRFEVRFLEIIRNILEWVKEKVDAKIESYEKQKPTKKERKENLQLTHRQHLRFCEIG